MQNATTQISDLYKPVAELTDYERGFLEAAIDGEGCIGMTRARRVRYRKPYYRSVIGYSYQVRILVRNTNFEFCKKIFGIIRRFGCCWIRTQRWGNGKWKPCHEVGVSSQALRRILPKLNLLIKQKQKNLIIEALYLLQNNSKLAGRFRTNRPMLEATLKKNYQRLDSIYAEIKALNFRGLQPACPERLKDLSDKMIEVETVEKVRMTGAVT